MSGLGRELGNLYARELDRLADEIAAYDSDSDLWSATGAQKNAPGTLALHTVGALSWFIGSGLGASGYVRDRDREFSERGLSRSEVVHRIRECRDTVVPVLERLDDAAMEAPYPGPTPDHLKGMSTRALLLHLLWHVGWHQGHVYYHRLGLAAPEAASGNLQAIQEVYEAFGRGDVPAILSHLSDDVEWEYGAGANDVPWLQPRKGRQGAADFFTSLQGLEIERFALKALLESEGTVVAIVDLEATARATGRRIVEEDEVHLWHFDDRGKVVRFRHRADRLQHQRACRAD